MANVDNTALFNIGYGLYVVTTNDGAKDNGCIVNTVNQVANNPTRITVSIIKQNYTHEIVKKTGKMNLNCLTVETPFAVFEKFGFQSGRDTNKLEGETLARTENGLVYLDKNINSYMSLDVEDYLDLGTHGLFICTVSEAAVVSDKESMTYSYYHKHVKTAPKKSETKKGWVCKVCGYVYESEDLPEDFICPLCKHPASDFERIV